MAGGVGHAARLAPGCCVGGAQAQVKKRGRNGGAGTRKPEAKRPPKSRLDAGGRARLQVVLKGTLGRGTATQLARPGSWEWMRARRRWTQAQEMAGERARSLWETIERCGIGGRDLALMTGGGGGGGDRMVMALDAIREAGRIREALGRLSDARLRLYLCQDMTLAEMAFLRGWSVRAMTAVLRADLDALAAHWGW